MTWSLLLLLGIYFLINVEVEILGPFYTKTATDKGVDAILVGVIFGMMPGVSFITSPIVGSLLHKISHRGGLVIGLLLQSSGMLVLGVSGSFHAAGFVALGLTARCLSGLSSAFSLTTCLSFAAVAEPEKLVQTIVLLEVAGGFGVMIGPVLAGALYSLLGFRGVFFVMGIVFMVGIPLALFLKAPPQQEKEETNWKEALQIVFSYRIVLLNSCAIVLAYGFVGTTSPFVSPHLLSMGFSVFTVGLCLAIAPCFYLAFSLLYGWIIQSAKYQYIIEAGLLCGGVGGMLLGPVYLLPSWPWLTLVGLAFIGAAAAAVYIPSLPDMIYMLKHFEEEALTDQIKSTLAGIATSAFALSLALGPVLNGTILHFLGFRVMTSVFAALMLAFGLIHIICYPRLPNDYYEVV